MSDNGKSYALYKALQENEQLRARLTKHEQAVSVPEETLTAIHDTLRLVWSRELSADDGLDEIEILISPAISENTPQRGRRLRSKTMTLEERAVAFQMLELPGQPMMMHVGTASLVNDLSSRIKELEAGIVPEATSLDDAAVENDEIVETDENGKPMTYWGGKAMQTKFIKRQLETKQQAIDLLWAALYGTTLDEHGNRGDDGLLFLVRLRGMSPRETTSLAKVKEALSLLEGRRSEC